MSNQSQDNVCLKSKCEQLQQIFAIKRPFILLTMLILSVIFYHQDKAIAQQQYWQDYVCEGQFLDGSAIVKGRRQWVTDLRGYVARQGFQGTIERNGRTFPITGRDIQGSPVSLMFLNSGILEIWEPAGNPLGAPNKIGTLLCR